ncbi:hypothetical protein CPB86DRAFT_816405 [Serendipita vermifera]|nr:hypothetical protein CPB86DRAFT_816405 [Serendipita vermifera]
MSATREILPGDTLRQITEEHRHMDEFVDWMKRRLELDRKYVEDLKALRTSVNPQWSQSGVSPLVSPMLELVTREVAERQTTCDTMNTYLKELSNVNSPDHNTRSGESMISLYEELIAACKVHDRIRNEASSTEAVKELKQWHETGPNGTNRNTLSSMDDKDLSVFLLPEVERNYRESVVRQQVLARIVKRWHHSHLPERFESHQSRSEEIKTLMARMASEHSRLLTAVVGHLEATKNNIHGFSSGSFISWAHNQHGSESEHEYMKEAVHVDFSNGTTRSNVIFGTISQTLLNVILAMEAMEKIKWDVLFYGKPTKDKALELEQCFATQTSSKPQFLSNDKIKLLYSFGLLSNPPLIPLDNEEIKRYASGISRKDMQHIMNRVTRQDEIAVLLEEWGRFPSSCRFILSMPITHRENSQKIIEDIYRKWDFSNNRPFPPGAERKLGRRSEL